MEFEGKTVLVTGAAGGIGQAIADRFAAQGARLVLADFDAEGLADLAARYEGALVYPGDLRDPAYCAALVAFAIEATGRLDVLLNNAGIITRGSILSSSDEDWARSLDINVTAVFYTCRAAIAHMKESGGGAIVNTASTWGLYPGPDHPIYCTSKAAVAALTKCLARDHAGDGIRINAVCPNEVNTPMLRSGFVQRGFDPDQAVAQLNETVPLGRIAEPEDIADVILFLASDQARYVAGATVEVSGAKAVH